nr:hypothetical protein [Tanacetum cinerariifolium]
MDPNSPKKTIVDKYDLYFQDDAERYRRTYEAYEQFQAMTNQEAEGSGSGIKRTHTYIPRDREEAEQRLLEDYFGERKPRKGQNQIKTGQKREACRSREKCKAVAVNRGRKTEQNAKRMAKNANAIKSYSSFKRIKKRRGLEVQILESITTGAKTQ